MLKFNLILALRNIKKYKFYSGLNIIGLAIGICCCLLISLFVLDELSFDKHHKNHERIYRVAADLKFEDNEFNMPNSPAPMAATFKEEFPEIMESGRFRFQGHTLIKKGDKLVKQEGVAFVDQGLLNIFNFPVLHGTLELALTEPNTVVISESVAKKVFGDENPVGQNLILHTNQPHRITAVIKDMRINSHFRHEVLTSMAGDDRSRDGMWLSNNFHTYFLLNESNNRRALEAKFPDMYRKYFGPQIEQMVGATYDQLLESNSRIHYFLQPIADIHLYSDLAMETSNKGNIQYVYLFSIIAFFILFIACINFMNLSTARAANRAKEVGIRKVLGTYKFQLINQFLTESILFSFIAFSIAIGLVYLFLPYFNEFTNKEIADPFFSDPMVFLSSIIITLTVGTLAGIYPAFVLSAFKPVSVLKGETNTGLKGKVFRNVLVVFQFTASMVLIICSIIVYRQLDYAQNKNLGYNREQVFVLYDVYTLGNQVNTFKNELLKNSKISNITISSYLPTNDSRNDLPYVPEGSGTGTEGAVSLQNWLIDTDYINTLGMNIINGRNFSKDLASDSSAVIINKTAVGRLGFDDPIGKKIKILGDFRMLGMNEFVIVGVIEDFHFESMRKSVYPMCLHLGKSDYSMAIRFNSENVREVVQDIATAWDEFAPNQPFEYAFMDDQFDAQYKSEQNLGVLFGSFASLAVIIACLGLFGLSSFTAEQKRKELGIRKVLGASIMNLIKLQFSNFTRLLVLAIIIGTPIAYYLMEKWLEGFAYRTYISIDIMIFSGVLVIAIAWLSVSYLSYKAASANPAQNLRTE